MHEIALLLTDNHIGVSGASMIADAIKQNKTMIELDLSSKLDARSHSNSWLSIKSETRVLQ